MPRKEVPFSSLTEEDYPNQVPSTEEEWEEFDLYFDNLKEEKELDFSP